MVTRRFLFAILLLFCALSPVNSAAQKFDVEEEEEADETETFAAQLVDEVAKAFLREPACRHVHPIFAMVNGQLHLDLAWLRASECLNYNSHRRLLKLLERVATMEGKDALWSAQQQWKVSSQDNAQGIALFLAIQKVLCRELERIFSGSRFVPLTGRSVQDAAKERLPQLKEYSTQGRKNLNFLSDGELIKSVIDALIGSSGCNPDGLFQFSEGEAHLDLAKFGALNCVRYEQQKQLILVAKPDVDLGQVDAQRREQVANRSAKSSRQDDALVQLRKFVHSRICQILDRLSPPNGLLQVPDNWLERRLVVEATTTTLQQCPVSVLGKVFTPENELIYIDVQMLERVRCVDPVRNAKLSRLLDTHLLKQALGIDPETVLLPYFKRLVAVLARIRHPYTSILVPEEGLRSAIKIMLENNGADENEEPTVSQRPSLKHDAKMGLDREWKLVSLVIQRFVGDQHCNKNNGIFAFDAHNHFESSAIKMEINNLYSRMAKNQELKWTVEQLNVAIRDFNERSFAEKILYLVASSSVQDQAKVNEHFDVLKNPQKGKNALKLERVLQLHLLHKGSMEESQRNLATLKRAYQTKSLGAVVEVFEHVYSEHLLKLVHKNSESQADEEEAAKMLRSALKGRDFERVEECMHELKKRQCLVKFKFPEWITEFAEEKNLLSRQDDDNSEGLLLDAEESEENSGETSSDSANLRARAEDPLGTLRALLVHIALTVHGSYTEIPVPDLLMRHQIVGRCFGNELARTILLQDHSIREAFRVSQVSGKEIELDVNGFGELLAVEDVQTFHEIAQTIFPGNSQISIPERSAREEIVCRQHKEFLEGLLRDVLLGEQQCDDLKRIFIVHADKDEVRFGLHELRRAQCINFQAHTDLKSALNKMAMEEDFKKAHWMHKHQNSERALLSRWQFLLHIVLRRLARMVSPQQDSLLVFDTALKREIYRRYFGELPRQVVAAYLEDGQCNAQIVEVFSVGQRGDIFLDVQEYAKLHIDFSEPIYAHLRELLGHWIDEELLLKWSDAEHICGHSHRLGGGIGYCVGSLHALILQMLERIARLQADNKENEQHILVRDRQLVERIVRNRQPMAQKMGENRVDDLVIEISKQFLNTRACLSAKIIFDKKKRGHYLGNNTDVHLNIQKLRATKCFDWSPIIEWAQGKGIQANSAKHICDWLSRWAHQGRYIHVLELDIQIAVNERLANEAMGKMVDRMDEFMDAASVRNEKWWDSDEDPYDIGPSVSERETEHFQRNQFDKNAKETHSEQQRGKGSPVAPPARPRTVMETLKHFERNYWPKWQADSNTNRQAIVALAKQYAEERGALNRQFVDKLNRRLTQFQQRISLVMDKLEALTSNVRVSNETAAKQREILHKMSALRKLNKSMFVRLEQWRRKDEIVELVISEYYATPGCLEEEHNILVADYDAGAHNKRDKNFYRLSIEALKASKCFEPSEELLAEVLSKMGVRRDYGEERRKEGLCNVLELLVPAEQKKGIAIWNRRLIDKIRVELMEKRRVRSNNVREVPQKAPNPEAKNQGNNGGRRINSAKLVENTFENERARGGTNEPNLLQILQKGRKNSNNSHGSDTESVAASMIFDQSEVAFGINLAPRKGTKEPQQRAWNESANPWDIQANKSREEEIDLLNVWRSGGKARRKNSDDSHGSDTESVAASMIFDD